MGSGVYTPPLKGWSDALTSALKDFGVDIEKKDAERHSQLFFDACVEGVKLFPDVIPFLTEVSEYILAVLSNAPHQDTVRKLKRLMIHQKFKYISGPEDVSCYKPDPGFFDEVKLVQKKIGFGAIIYVGDSLVSDVECARKAGISAVLLDRYGVHDEQALDVPVIQSLNELPRLLDTL